MCPDCGCEIPENKHDDDRNINWSEIVASAEANDISSRTAALSKTVNTLFGAVLLLVALLGFTGIDLVHTLLNITESTDPDNFLHLVTGGLALYFGTAGATNRHVVTP